MIVHSGSLLVVDQNFVVAQRLQTDISQSQVLV